jgi:vesicle coat complex subunit
MTQQQDQGFLQVLRDLICDPNPTVVANAVAALSEVSGHHHYYYCYC